MSERVEDSGKVDRSGEVRRGEAEGRDEGAGGGDRKEIQIIESKMSGELSGGGEDVVGFFSINI